MCWICCQLSITTDVTHTVDCCSTGMLPPPPPADPPADPPPVPAVPAAPPPTPPPTVDCLIVELYVS